MDEFVNLSNFFAVFVALNLAYSGSKGFRLAIDRDILKLQSILDELNLSTEALIESLIFFPDSEQKERILFYIFGIEALKHEREKNLEFEKRYRKIFLSSGLFCLVMILLIGLGTINNGKWNDFIITIISYSFLIAVVELYIFISGFTNKSANFLIPSINKTTLIIILILIYSIAFSCAYFNHKIFPLFPKCDVYKCIIFSIVIAISPYVLFFIKAFLYIFKSRFLCNIFYKEIDKIKKDLEEIEKESEQKNVVDNFASEVNDLASELEKHPDTNYE